MYWCSVWRWWLTRQAIAMQIEKTWNAWHLAVEIVPPSDTCRQGHHRRLAPSGTCPPPGDLEA